MKTTQAMRETALTLLAVASMTAVLVLVPTGCNGCNSAPAAAPIVDNGSQAGNTGADPALANQAPLLSDGTYGPAPAQPVTRVAGQSQSYTPQQQGTEYTQQQAAPIERSDATTSNYNESQNYDNNYANDTNDSNASYAYNQVPVNGADGSYEDISAEQAPPPLPVYEQPPAPEPDYLWNPGYWGYATAGYYWVPGVWVAPPYAGALWTPPYWGYYGHRYFYHHGYWGLHVGFYGGIDYGHGYVGSGYYGGYWQNRNFYYNRSVTNVNIANVHNVYNRTVIYNNTVYRGETINRTSYNGPTGVRYQPAPYERVAMHEQHTPPMATQQQFHQEAEQNRGNYFAQNAGRPQQVVVQNRVIQATPGMQRPVLPQREQVAEQQQRQQVEAQQQQNARQQDAQREQQQNAQRQQQENLQREHQQNAQRQQQVIQQQQHANALQQRQNNEAQHEQQLQANAQAVAARQAQAQQHNNQQREQQLQQQAQQNAQHQQQTEQRQQQTEQRQQQTEQRQQQTEQQHQQQQAVRQEQAPRPVQAEHRPSTPHPAAQAAPRPQERDAHH